MLWTGKDGYGESALEYGYILGRRGSHMVYLGVGVACLEALDRAQAAQRAWGGLGRVGVGVGVGVRLGLRWDAAQP